MCSIILQTIYIVGIAAAAALTTAALVTPAWAPNAQGSAQDSASLIWNCMSNNNNCKGAFQNLQGYQLTAAILMIVAIVVCVVAFAWGLFTCCACCCHSCLFPMLPILAGIACGADVVAVIVYGANIAGLTASTIGYSMWLAIVAVIILAVETVLSIFLCECCAFCP